MRRVLKGYLALEEGGFEGNPHPHRDGGDTLVDVAKVQFDTLRDFQPSSLSIS